MTALRPKEQFRSMLQNVVQRTQTGAVSTMRDGSAKLSDAIDAAVERHHDKWKQNLIASWGTLDAGEIRKVCIAIGEGDATRLTIFSTRIVGEVQKRNEPLLNRAGVEVLSAVDAYR